MPLDSESHICVRCGDRFSRNACPFSQLLACGPLCASWLDDILEHARSRGGDDEFEAHVVAHKGPQMPLSSLCRCR
jgi:hypothetical protein